MPNETFSRRHDALPSFWNWISADVDGASMAQSMAGADQMHHAPPDAVQSACSPELDEGEEEHRETILKARGAAVKPQDCNRVAIARRAKRSRNSRTGATAKHT